MGQLLAQSAARITAALAFQLLPAHAGVAAAAANALRELTAALGANAAAISVTLANGAEWLRV